MSWVNFKLLTIDNTVIASKRTRKNENIIHPEAIISNSCSKYENDVFLSNVVIPYICV